ncbi:MotA/TolQ/ExbB proton channel family protein [Candidatus Poribacteria bacterium]|nr:MotA/TolQ/ExbB proton channel family protein [Candidatus Poribacteria bacterium]
MLELFLKGGIFMWPILLCSILGLAIILERFFSSRKIKLDIDGFMNGIVEILETNAVGGKVEVKEALARCDAQKGPVPAVIRAGLLKVQKGVRAMERAMTRSGLDEMESLERGLTILAILGTISPLLGFLGTVSGMIQSFGVIAQSATRDFQRVAAGISEALITTAAGLVVAIPIYIAYNYFSRKVNQFVLDMESSAEQLLETFEELPQTPSLTSSETAEEMDGRVKHR